GPRRSTAALFRGRARTPGRARHAADAAPRHGAPAPDPRGAAAVARRAGALSRAARPAPPPRAARRLDLARDSRRASRRRAALARAAGGAGPGNSCGRRARTRQHTAPAPSTAQTPPPKVPLRRFLESNRQPDAGRPRRSDRPDWRSPGIDVGVQRIFNGGEQLGVRPAPTDAAIEQCAGAKTEIIPVVIELREL